MKIRITECTNDIDEYFSYQILLRTIINSKLSQGQFDHIIMGSETISEISLSIIEEIERLEEKIRIGPAKQVRGALLINSKDDVRYKAIFKNILESGDIESLFEIEEESRVSAQKRYAEAVFAPFILSATMLESFLSDIYTKSL